MDANGQIQLQIIGILSSVDELEKIFTQLDLQDVKNHLKTIENAANIIKNIVDEYDFEFSNEIGTSKVPKKKGKTHIAKDNLESILKKSILQTEVFPIDFNVKKIEKVEELAREIRNLISSIDQDQGLILKKSYLIGRYLGRLKAKKGSFNKNLIQNNIKYDPRYASFLVDLAQFFYDFRILLQSNLSIHFFKKNWKAIKIIIQTDTEFWKQPETSDSGNNFYNL
jgi:hypothetical protein